MGIFGAIIAIGSAIATGIGSICGAIGSGIGKIASVASRFASSVISGGPILYPTLPLTEIFHIIGSMVSKISEMLCLKQPEKDEPDELGMKAERAEQKPDDFASTEEYIRYLHQEIHVDEDEKKKLTPEMQAAYTAVGSTLYLNAAKEKLGVDEIAPEFLLDASKLALDAKEIVSYIQSLRDAGLSSQKEMSAYLHGSELSDKSMGKVQGAMMSSIKELNPDMNDEQIAEKMLKMESEIQAAQ